MEIAIEMTRSSLERGTAMAVPDFEVALDRPAEVPQFNELGNAFASQVQKAGAPERIAASVAAPTAPPRPDAVEAALKRVWAAIDYSDFAAASRSTGLNIPALTSLGHAARDRLNTLQISYGEARDSIRSSFDSLAKQVGEAGRQDPAAGIDEKISTDPLVALREVTEFQRESNVKSQQRYMEMMRLSYDLNDMQIRTTFVTTIAGKSLKNHDMLLRGQ